MDIKYLIGGIIILGMAGSVWYWQMGSMNMNMGTMMMNQNIPDAENLSLLTDTNVPEVKPTEIIELKNGDTYELVASVVKQEVGNHIIKRLAYNGQIPGPIITAPKGSKVTINFVNNLDMETALHAHGLRGDWKMDGAVPITPPVAIGDSFNYELEFPDTGVFWYHPHVREDYQQDMGLYGNFIVTEENYWSEVDKEAYLIVDDVLEDGEYSSKVVTNTLMGRFGDRLLINDSNEYNLTVRQGEITRAFITNVANTRTFDLAFAGAQMKLVGGDNGRIEREVMIKNQIIAPSERYVIELLYDTPGTYDIIHRGAKLGTVTVEPSGTNRSTAFQMLRSNTADYASFRNDMTALLAKAPDKNLRLDIEMKGMMADMMQMEATASDGKTVTMMGMEMTKEQASAHCQMMPGMAGCESLAKDTDSQTTGRDSNTPEVDDGIEWEDTMVAMNQMSTKDNVSWFIEDTVTKARNDDIDWSFKKDDLVKIRIKNDENGLHPMQHPIHFHGQRFVVLARDGVANDNLQWKDSVLIPKGETIDVLVEMSNPGNWMAHCHIAEHLESGMMFEFKVD